MFKVTMRLANWPLHKFPNRHRSIVDPAFYLAVDDEASALADMLIQSESATEFEREISPDTRSLIAGTNDSYTLLLVRRKIMENEDIISDWLRRKLLRALGEQTDVLDPKEASMYRLPSDRPDILKFTSIRTGNDLFTMAGIYDLAVLPRGKYVKDGRLLFQRNDDRDYTGSLLVELGTDYLNIHGRNPSRSYQTVLYGFDVYTPYFLDKVKFSTDTSTNKRDRPHASFQYFGWSRKTLSFNNKIRWQLSIKGGLIGGTAGSKFQNTLHRDISYSDQPRGWESQIANGGRVGISFEYKLEMQRRIPDRNFYYSVFTEDKLGTYMTTAGLGVQVSNKSFAHTNSNFISLYSRKKSERLRQVFRQHFMYNVSFTYHRIVHNTMLEGYGIFKTNEDKTYDKTISYYALAKERVRRNIGVLNIALSYSTKYITYFYNWKSFSPETTNGNIEIGSRASGENMDISKRWHHFAEIGVAFYIL
jgi:hypothetical protein